jgi:abortive infection bacteriophage resistance protein
MEERHISVPDKEFAIQVLQNYSYYGIINGYKNTFLQVPNSDSFIPGTNFNELYTLHIIDTSLNNIIFKYILFLEKALKSRISYLVAQKYGVYTNPLDLRCLEENDYLYLNEKLNSSCVLSQ